MTNSHHHHTSCALLAAFVVAAAVSRVEADETPGGGDSTPDVFARNNLVAWCIVPFDAKRRGPEERAEMLERLRFKRFAYDWRAEHVATFDAEMDALKRHGIKLEAFWFPAALNGEARTILDLLGRHKLHTQLWITMGDPAPEAKAQTEKVRAAAGVLRPIAEEAAAIGCSVALYNHGGWFGEPENQLAVIDELKLANVGIVYNLHHGHDHIDRFAELLKKVRPKLVALNLNGMFRDGERIGRKIVPLGQGPLDLELLKTIRDSGYRGPIGILGHTDDDDAEDRLRDNLEGLDWLIPQLAGIPAGPKPKPRTYTDAPPASAPHSARGWLTEGKPEYRTLPLTAGPQLKPTDERLKVVLIDRSEHEAYMAVKADSLGRLFVAGREAVFVFEPKPGGGYRPRQELYRFPPDSIIIGLELRGNDLYVLTSSALYLFAEGRTQREGLQPMRLVWGLPLDLHVSFHCLAWGPEGDLYLNHGDPLLNYGDWNRPDHWGHWTLHCQPEGTKVPYTGTGAVLRVKPDGSDLRVVAGGLRGPVGLAFDNQWNLFTNDNDHESRAEQYAPARLLHVTPHADFAWPRGWLPAKSPDRRDLLETMNVDMGRGVPCDMVYYDEPFFPDDLRRSLLMCRWDRMAVMRYPPRPRGASFEADELAFLAGENDVRPVGVTVGRGGRVFVTSLYLSGNVVSPNCPSDLAMITRADDPPDHPFQPYEITELPPEEFWAELSSDSLQRRQRAHVEILRRGGELLAQAVDRLRETESGPAMTHLIWLAAAEGDKLSQQLLRRLANHPDAEHRLQALRALAEFPCLSQQPTATCVKRRACSWRAARRSKTFWSFHARATPTSGWRACWRRA
ncbi:MAG TPA: TIM barrel protein [Pirellulales bacterium]|nr:TIM barrel protein [Pirellulales bacterium]